MLGRRQDVRFNLRENVCLIYPVRAILVLAAVLVSIPASARAQQSEIDKAAAHIAERMGKASRKKVIVADFIAPKQNVNELGRQLADQLSFALANANHNLEILPRNGISSRVAANAGEAIAAWMLAKVAGAETVIVGDMNRSSDTVHLSLRVWDIPRYVGKGPQLSAGVLLKELSVRISITPEEEELLKHSFATAAEVQLLTAGFGRSASPSIPSCLDCPPPPRTTKRATVLLRVTVNADGRVGDVVLQKTSDPDVAQIAIETVRKWLFLPALGSDSRPISAQVPVEITTNKDW